MATYSKLKWLLLALLAIVPMARAQQGYTTVTATVKDPLGQLYVNAPYSALFFDPGTSGKLPLLNGSTFQTSFTGVNTNSLGSLAVTLPDNQVIGATSGATGTSWTFNVCSQLINGQKYCFTYNSPIDCLDNIPSTCTNNSMDISAQLQAVAATLPVPNSLFLLVNGVVVTNPNVADSPCIKWNVATNQIQASIGPGCGGGGGGGGGSSVSVNGVGVASPNFANSGVFQFNLAGDGVTVTGIPIAPGSEGSIVVNHSNAFQAVANFGLDDGAAPTTFTNGYILRQNGNAFFKGPNPYNDIDGYGGRAVTTVPTTTATITGGTATATLAGASTFKNGDGIFLIDGGATNSLVAPTSCTVTVAMDSGPMSTGRYVAGLAGSTPYGYKVVARDQGQGLTLPTAECTTSTGQATLGPVSLAISTLTRVGYVVTAVTSSPHGLPVGCTGGAAGTCPRVYVVNSTDASFSGWYKLTSVPSNTSFTYTQLAKTVPGPTSTGPGLGTATGGTVLWRNENVITFPAATGGTPWSYYIYGRTSGGPWNLIGQTVPGDLFWQDYGATATANAKFPVFVPSTPPVSATNDTLSTTICAGAGTTTLTLCGNALNSTSSTLLSFDDYPAFKTCLSMAGSCRFPAGPLSTVYYLGDFGTYTSTGTNTFTVIQSGQVSINDTQLFSVPTTWATNLGGSSCQAPQFAWNCGETIITNGAYPALDFGSNSGANLVSGVYFAINDQGLAMMMSGFNNSVIQDMFKVGTQSDGSDYTGKSIIFAGASQLVLMNVTSVTSGPTGGQSDTPNFFLRNDAINVNPSGGLYCYQCYFTQRTIGDDSNPTVGGQQRIELEDSYAQAQIMPTVVSERPNGVALKIHGYLPDTAAVAMFESVAQFSQSVADLEMIANSAEAGGRPAAITGSTPMAAIQTKNMQMAIGQDTNLSDNGSPVTGGTPAASTIPGLGYVNTAYQTFAEPVALPSPYELFVPLAAPTNVVANPTAGGTLAAGTNTYNVTAISLSGGETGPSPTSTCVTGAGNLTCTITWNAVPGAVGYNVYWDGITHKNATPVLTNSYTDSAPGCCNHNYPSKSGAGQAGIGGNNVYAQQFQIWSPLAGGTSPVGTTTATLSANRNWLDPDASGTFCVTGFVNCDFFLDAGVVNAYTFCPAPIPIPQYQIGQHFTFQVANGNTGAVTVNVCSVGAKAVKKNGGTGGSIGVDLVTGDWKTGQIEEIAYDGFNFQCLTCGGTGGSGTVSTTGSPASPEMACFSGATTVTNCNLSGDGHTTNTTAFTLDKIQTVPVNTSSVQPGQILNVCTGPQYCNQYPGVNYNPQSTTYSIACPGDRLGYVDFTGSSATTFTLAQANSTACLGSGASYFVHNGGSAVLTLAATTSTIDGIAGATGVQILPGEARLVYEDPASPNNYHTTHIRSAYGGINTQTANYTAVPSDFGKLVLMNCPAACTFTLPATPPITGETAAGTRWNVRVMSIGASLAAISLNSLTFNGSASIPILNKYVEQPFSTDGSNYFGSAPIVCGSGMTCTPNPQGLNLVANATPPGVTQVNTSGCLSGGPITTTGTIGSNTCLFENGVSDVTARSTSQGSTTIATAPAAGRYQLNLYADVNTPCTTGGNTVLFTATWIDATATRTLTTGSLSMAAGQPTGSAYLSGLFPIQVASGNVTYTSTITGSCASGTSSYDVHVALVGVP